MKRHDNTPALVVIKLGGSVLSGLPAYRRCAAYVRDRLATRPDERYVAVASARLGATDELESLARTLCPDPTPGALDLLWSTGELQSVALLTLCLQQLGVNAVGLGVHETGLTCADGAGRGTGLRLDPRLLRHHLTGHAVAVVPGFFARGPLDQVVSLGRGGSDFSAVLLAAWLPAARCELLKDVPGYFSRDPNVHADAEPLPWLSYERALAMAAAGCDLVQPRALAAAAETRTMLVIRSLDDGAPYTVVSAADPRLRAADESPRRTCVA